MENISIRNARYAKIGLYELLLYIAERKEDNLLFSIMKMVEIGCYVGDATEIFANYFFQIYAVDPWINGYDDNDLSSFLYDMKVIEKQFDRLVTRFPNIKKMKMTSEIAVNQFKNNSLDLVYIDGLHTYEGVKKDIQLWKSKIKIGGWLAGHDYQKRFPGAIKAVNEFKKPDHIFRDTSWIIRL